MMTQCNEYSIVCKLSDLAGKSDVDQARADMLIDCFEDTMKPAFTFFFEKDETKKVCKLVSFLPL